MLQKLDAEHLNRLALAEALASMEPRDFDMRRTDRCICGHALRLFGIRSPYFGGWQSQLGAGANLLGLSTDQARELFAPVNRAKHSDHIPIPRMRHEWCDISLPPIPSIGASLASFSRFPQLHSILGQSRHELSRPCLLTIRGNWRRRQSSQIGLRPFVPCSRGKYREIRRFRARDSPCFFGKILIAGAGAARFSPSH